VSPEDIPRHLYYSTPVTSEDRRRACIARILACGKWSTGKFASVQIIYPRLRRGTCSKLCKSSIVPRPRSCMRPSCGIISRRFFIHLFFFPPSKATENLGITRRANRRRRKRAETKRPPSTVTRIHENRKVTFPSAGDSSWFSGNTKETDTSKVMDIVFVYYLPTEVSFGLADPSFLRCPRSFEPASYDVVIS